MERAIEVRSQLLNGTENQLIAAIFPCEPLAGIVVCSCDRFAVDGEAVRMRPCFAPRARRTLIEKRQFEGSVAIDEEHDVKAVFANQVHHLRGELFSVSRLEFPLTNNYVCVRGS